MLRYHSYLLLLKVSEQQFFLVKPEDGGSRFFRNVGNPPTSYHITEEIRPNLHGESHWNPKTPKFIWSPSTCYDNLSETVPFKRQTHLAAYLCILARDCSWQPHST
jgi:hypothetical protein